MNLDAEIYLDSAYAIALSAPADQHHARAATLADEIARRLPRIVTTRAVLLEIGNALARARFRAAAVRLLTAIEGDPLVEIVPVTEELCLRAWDLFRQRPDKEWSWTDCISFTVMSQRKIRQALTPDEHFDQAGFVRRFQLPQS